MRPLEHGWIAKRVSVQLADLDEQVELGPLHAQTVRLRLAGHHQRLLHGPCHLVPERANVPRDLRHMQHRCLKQTDARRLRKSRQEQLQLVA
eukprot:scaffold33407_cov112-Isochrysis_galbana.AAC.2